MIRKGKLDGWQEMIFFDRFSSSTALLTWQPKNARQTLGNNLSAFETCSTTPSTTDLPGQNVQTNANWPLPIALRSLDTAVEESIMKG